MDCKDGASCVNYIDCGTSGYCDPFFRMCRCKVDGEAGQAIPDQTSLQINRRTLGFGYASKSALYICIKTRNNQILSEQETRGVDSFLQSKLLIVRRVGIN